MVRVSPTVKTASVWLSLAGSAWLVWELRIGLLLALGAVLAAMMLHLVERSICRVTGMRDSIALTLAVLLILIAFVVCGWLFEARLTTQFGQVIHQIQAGLRELGPFRSFAGNASTLIGQTIPTALSSGLVIAEFAVVVAIAAIYIAAQPDMYRRGLVALFPRPLRADVAEALKVVGAALQYWLLGQLIIMVIVGAFSYCGMLIIGLPNPLALALIAGIAEIIPYVGPFIGAVPAILVALTIGLAPALWTLAVYIAIHIFEGYLIAPLLQRRFVHIPPALILMSILFSQLLFGPLGVMFAAPIAVFTYTAVKLLYVRDTLNEQVELPERIEF